MCVREQSNTRSPWKDSCVCACDDRRPLLRQCVTHSGHTLRSVESGGPRPRVPSSGRIAGGFFQTHALFPVTPQTPRRRQRPTPVWWCSLCALSPPRSSRHLPPVRVKTCVRFCVVVDGRGWRRCGVCRRDRRPAQSPTRALCVGEQPVWRAAAIMSTMCASACASVCVCVSARAVPRAGGRRWAARAVDHVPSAPSSDALEVLCARPFACAVVGVYTHARCCSTHVVTSVGVRVCVLAECRLLLLRGRCRLNPVQLEHCRKHSLRTRIGTLSLSLSLSPTAHRSAPPPRSVVHRRSRGSRATLATVRETTLR